ncbi:MAG: ATP cone domain-containing protein [Candidatus Thiodiazotropha sp.]
MAKTLIIDKSDKTRTPFLRGILTRSLTDAGLSFETAYQLSSEIRQQIGGKEEVTTTELRNLVTKRLGQMSQHEVAANYESHTPSTIEIQVTGRKGATSPFSLLEHRQTLESTGLSSDKAALISQSVFLELLESRKEGVTTHRIGRLTYEKLKQRYGKEAARNYLVWIDHKHSKRPLILLIGGTTGCGKSTIATEVAHRLSIIRTQSTDMLREVMRMMIPERLLPGLHTSSFNAWSKIPGQKLTNVPKEELMIQGYLYQTELVSVPCEAVVQRALKERVSLILEGVHVSPALFQRFSQSDDAVIVPIMLAVLKQDKLKHHLKDRGISAPARSSQSHYMSHFDSIWLLQTHLLSVADDHSVPIISNDLKDVATDSVMRSIIEVLGKRFHGQLDDVFRPD